MTRETKVGLLVGMGIILLIGIVVSDHLSKVQQQQPANFTDMGRETFDSLTTRRDHALPSGVPVANPARQTLLERTSPIPMANEVITQPQPGSRTSVADQTRYRPQPTYSPHPTPTVLPSRIPEAQPPIRTTPRQPRRVENMSEEQALAMNNNKARAIPPMASVLEPRNSDTTSRTGMYHTVSSGENLYTIAQKYYNNGEAWTLIRDANRDVVMPNGTIRVGSRLLIPSKKQISGHRYSNGANNAGNAPREIVVKSGQTLSELAKQYLGNAADWDELLKANRDQLSRPEQLRAGMTLKLPQKAARRATVARSTTKQPTNTSHSTTKAYTIEPGDTLSSIAADKLGSAGKWYKLYEHNKSVIRDPDNLTVGTTIKIP